VSNRTRHSWNEAVAAAIPDGPANLLTQPVWGDRYSLAWSEFAPSFVQDLENWLERLRGEDLLAGLPFKPLRAISIENRRAQVRQLASGWVRRGNDPASLRSLADLVRPEVAREALRFHLERRPDRKPTLGIFDYTWALLAIARHWVRVDEATLAVLRNLADRCKPEGEGITLKNMRVLRAFDDTELRDRLLGLPRRLVRGIGKGDRLTRVQALRVQTALMIEILIVAPVRLRNLAALDLDRHFERPGGGRGAMLLRFAPNEVKNATGLHHELRAATQKLLDLYLTSARPVLCGVPGTLLFPGRSGRPKTHSAIKNQISGMVYKELGIRMTPHQFRHVAGKIVLDQMPGALSLVSDLLGHKSTETARRFYGGLDRFAPPSPTTSCWRGCGATIRARGRTEHGTADLSGRPGPARHAGSRVARARSGAVAGRPAVSRGRPRRGWPCCGLGTTHLRQCPSRGRALPDLAAADRPPG
jgi:integrase